MTARVRRIIRSCHPSSMVPRTKAKLGTGQGATVLSAPYTFAEVAQR